MTQHIDPWQIQRTLMDASDQNLPKEPELNKGVLLYAALNMEELSETVAALSVALAKVADATEGGALGKIATIFAQAAEEMHAHSVAVRDTLAAEVPDSFRAEISEDDVVELADGATDLTVTNSGLALSLGLDGAACYADVGGSNLSKRNPDTGKIEKTPDGKWIKGRDFRKPNLRAVIFGHRGSNQG